MLISLFNHGVVSLVFKYLFRFLFFLFVITWLFIFLLLLFLLFFLFRQKLVNLFTILDSHLIHPAPNIIPVRANSAFNKQNKILFRHPITFFSQELQQINDIIGSCLFQNQSLKLSLFLACLLSSCISQFFISFRLDLRQFFSKSFFKRIIKPKIKFHFFSNIFISFSCTSKTEIASWAELEGQYKDLEMNMSTYCLIVL